MLTDEHREALILFNEKAEILRKSRFVYQLRTRGLGISEHWEIGKPFRVGGKKPDDEAIAAAMLTLRFFIRDGEICSIRNLSKVYSNLIKPIGIADQFAEVRRILNDYLDSPLRPKLIIGAKPSSSQSGLPLTGGRELRQRDILDVVIYGNFFHANTDKRKEYKAIFTARFFISQTLTSFILIMANLVRVVSHVERLNRKVLHANRQV